MSTEPEAEAFARRLASALDEQADRPEPRRPDQPQPPEVDAQTAAVLATLREPSTWSGPPPDLRGRILAAASAEHAAPTHPSSRDQGVPPAPVRPPAAPEPGPAGENGDDVATVTRLVPRWRRLAVAVPLAAVAASVFTVAVLRVDDVLNRPEGGTTYVAAGTPLAPRADAEVTVAPSAAGFSVVIDAENLPAAAPGSYYAAFLSGPRGVVPLGSFHGRKSGKPITMWSGVDPADYPEFTVTLQREGGPPGPSQQVVLRGSLS